MLCYKAVTRHVHGRDRKQDVGDGLCGAQIHRAPAFRGEEGLTRNPNSSESKTNEKALLKWRFCSQSAVGKGAGAGGGWALGWHGPVTPWCPGLGRRATGVEGALDLQQRRCSH